MLDIAHETGSSEFLRPLRRLGLPVRIKNLSSADFAFYGSGPEGECRIGVERKTISEMVGVGSRGRLIGHQLPRMTNRYRFRFLIVEGLTRVDPQWGSLELGLPIKRDRMVVWQEAGWGRERSTYEKYLKRNLTLRLKGAMHILPSTNKTETAHVLHALYGWFQTDWSKHKSHLKVDEVLPDHVMLDERTVKRQLLAQIPGIGWGRSLAISKKFKDATIAQTLTWMAQAGPKDWMDLLGIERGTKTATNIYQVLNGKDDHDAKG